MDQFSALGLSEVMLGTLAGKGFTAPTPVQQAVIPVILHTERDVVAQAQTGTGKTAAFGIPIIERLETGRSQVQALIVVPTRELALQVAGELGSLARGRKLAILPVYGGQSFPPQLKRLQQGVDIVVGTPGRLCDHLRRGSLKLNAASYVVLDEADEMFDMGFIEDIEAILSQCPPHRRTLLFSATMPRPVLKIAQHYMGAYETLVMTPPEQAQSLTEQIYYEVREEDKFEALCRIIDHAPEFYGLVFCRTRADTAALAAQLNARGYKAEGLHGEIHQDERERIMRRFRNRDITVLAATDVAARGIDIGRLSHVVNYDLPQDAAAYIHRIGRTGRAGRQGVAVTLVTPREHRALEVLRRAWGKGMHKGTIPSVTEVMAAKRARIRQAIEHALRPAGADPYAVLAEELLNGGETHAVLAACLRHAFAGELDATRYAEIASGKPTTAARQTRLRVARGKRQGLTPQKLVRLIREETGVKEKLVRDIEVLDNCTFISVPKAEAVVIERTFRHHKVLISKVGKKAA